MWERVGGGGRARRKPSAAPRCPFYSPPQRCRLLEPCVTHWPLFPYYDDAHRFDGVKFPDARRTVDVIGGRFSRKLSRRGMQFLKVGG
jgi:hypothetical protein